MIIIDYLLLMALVTAVLFGLYSLLLRWLHTPVRAGGERRQPKNEGRDNQASRLMGNTKAESRPRGVPLFRNEAVGTGSSPLRVEYGSELGRRSQARIMGAARLKSFTASSLSQKSRS